MYPEDIERLFDLTPVGTRVTLINEPVKISRFGGEVWLEVHPPVDEKGQVLTVDIEVFEARLNELLGESEVIIDWEMALRALREATGMPVLVGLELVPEGAAESEVPATAAASVPAQRP
jgi:L,D-transpeptidase ErfK/SrfK